MHKTYRPYRCLGIWAAGLLAVSVRAAEPVIQIDYLPQLGSGGSAEGRVVWDGLTAANADQYAVIAMLNVWDTYVKPSYENYLNAISIMPLGAFTIAITTDPDGNDNNVDPLAFFLVERSAFTGIVGSDVRYYNMTPDRYLAKLDITRSAFWSTRLTPPSPNVRPAFLPAGTAITLSAQSGADIWYTTDGTNPTNSATRQAYTLAAAPTVPAQGCLILKTAAANASATIWSDAVTYTYFPREDLSRAPFFGLNTALNISNESFSAALSRDTVRERLQPLKPLCRWIRTFGTVGAGLGYINDEAKNTFQMKTVVGVYITTNTADNAAQLAGLDALLALGPAPDIVLVGNETYYEGVPPAILTNCIAAARAILAAHNMLVPVGTADIFGPSFERSVLDSLDVIGLNFYPGVWTDTPLENALAELQAQYAAALAAFPDKLVLLSEAGVPYAGGPYTVAGSTTKNPTPALAAAFLDGFLEWTRREHIPAFYFQAYAQPVKSQDDGHPIEQYFGLMDAPSAIFDFYQFPIDKHSPIFARIAIEDNRPVITWAPDLRPDFSYVIEETGSLSQPNWTTSPIPLPPVTGTSSRAQGFFRVRRTP